MTDLIRVTGLCSAIGGVVWTAGCFVHNSLPQGCIDEACEGPQAVPLRGNSPVAVALFAAAGVLIVVSGLGLMLIARRAGSGGRTGTAAVLVGGLGLALLLAAGIVSGFVDSDWNGMPGLVVPGVLLLAVGAALMGWVMFRSRVLPIWMALILLGTALLLPFANEQTSRILFAVPFGVAWFVSGVTLIVQAQPSELRAARPVA